MPDDKYPYRHHGPAVHGSKLADFLVSEANMTDAMQAQTDAVIRLLGERYSPQDLRDIGYSQRAIDAAINAITARSDQP